MELNVSIQNHFVFHSRKYNANNIRPVEMQHKSHSTAFDNLTTSGPLLVMPSIYIRSWRESV